MGRLLGTDLHICDGDSLAVDAAESTDEQTCEGVVVADSDGSPLMTAEVDVFGDDEEADEMLTAAIDVVVESGQASTSMLQRRLKLGYSRAARIIDQMEERGIVGEFEGSKPRKILITRDEWNEMKMRREDM